MSYLALLGSPWAAMGLTAKGLKSFFKKHPLKGQSLNVDNGQSYSGDYGDLRAADPYSSYSYQMGPWESFLRSFGFRTKYDQFAESMNLQSQEYQAGITEKQYNEAYDSPASQAQRMREAGQNPDLVGTSGVEASSPLRDDGNPLGAVPDADLASTPKMFADFVMTGVSSAVGFASSLENFKSLKLANQGAEIGNSASIIDFAIDALQDFMPMPQDLEYNPDAISDARYKSYGILRDKYRGVMSKKNYKQFMNAIDALWSSAPTSKEAYKTWSEEMTSAKDFHKISTSKYYDRDPYSLYLISEELNKYNDKVQDIMLHYSVTDASLKNEKASNDLVYQQDIDPSLSAETFNEQNESSKLNAEMEQAMNSTIRDICNKLSKKAAQGDVVSQAILLFFSTFRGVSVGSSGASGSFGIPD